jgi:hypothetical protein
VRLAVRVPRGHPRLDVKLLRLPHAQIARADVHNSIGQSERAQNVLGVLEDFMVPAFAFVLVVAADDDLLDLVE